jgi:hypothetical protein
MRTATESQGMSKHTPKPGTLPAIEQPPEDQIGTKTKPEKKAVTLTR